MNTAVVNVCALLDGEPASLFSQWWMAIVLVFIAVSRVLLVNVVTAIQEGVLLPMLFVSAPSELETRIHSLLITCSLIRPCYDRGGSYCTYSILFGFDTYSRSSLPHSKITINYHMNYFRYTTNIIVQ